MSKTKLPNGIGRRIYVWLGYCSGGEDIESLYGDPDYKAQPGVLERVQYADEIMLCAYGLHAAKLSEPVDEHELIDSWNHQARYTLITIRCFLCLVDEHPIGLGGQKVVSSQRVLFKDEWSIFDTEWPRLGCSWNKGLIRRIVGDGHVEFKGGAAYYTGPAFWDTTNPVIVGCKRPQEEEDALS